MPLHRPTRDSRRAGRGFRVPGGTLTVVFTGFVLFLLALIETGARFARTDAEDAFPLFALLLLSSLVRRRHARTPLPWVAALGRLRGRIVAAARRRTLVIGVDLRGEPPLPEAFPPLLGAGVAVLTGGALLLALFPGLDLLVLRDTVRLASATLWSALLGAGWVLLAGGGFYLLFLTFALAHDAMVRAHTGPGPRRRGRESLALCGWVSAILLGWALLPPWVPVVLLTAAVLATLLVLTLPGGPDTPLLWKPRADGSPVRSTSWCRHTLAGTACIALLVAEAVLLVKGPLLRGGGEGAERLMAVFPLTLGCASLLAWTGAAALAAWTQAILLPPLRARFRDPSRPTPARVLAAETAGLEGLEGRGVRLRGGAGPANPCEVPVAISAAPRDPFALPLRGGPLLVTVAEIDSGEALRRILRRRDILARRQFLRGLEGLFRKAAGRTFARGSGLWVAPWLWFCVGLSRDEDERTMDWKEGTFFLETIGPSYHRVLPREALQHAHVVMRDLKVDLIFVEDGVGFRRLRRVLRTAFDLHDRQGARGRAEDHHFGGQPGVRVMIHDFDMDEPWKAKRKGWPEPDYESVGRGRILHVYRDRGESEETVESPRDRRGAPLLV